MENTNQPNPPQEPNEAVPAVEARLSTLEQRMTEQSAAFETMTAENRRVGKAELSAELDHHRDQLRDYEKALVERIADVDDDRRATASRLQRAWQTQQEEIDERLRRHAGLLGGLLMLFAILFAVALFLVYRQATMTQPQVAAEVSENRQELGRSSGEVAVAEKVREKLDGLVAEVGEIASALDQLDKDGEQAVQVSLAAERAAREQAEDRLAAEVRRLDAEYGRLAGDLGSLRSAMETLAGTVGKSAVVDEAGATPVSMATAPEDVTDEAGGVLDEGNGPGEPEQLQQVPGSADPGATQAESGDGTAGAESDAVTSGPEETLVAGGDIYALQLIGFFNRKSLDEFVAREGLPARVYSIRKTYRGRPWYVIIHSVHDDYAAAEDELSRLSADLVALNPWIRPLSQVTELQIVETGQEPEQESESTP